MGEQSYTGRVSSVLHEADDFRIAKILLDGGNGTPVTVKGHFPAQHVNVGSWVSFAGKWVTHARYGKQLSVTRSPIAIERWTEDRTMSALTANGIGPQLRFQLRLYAKEREMSVSELLDSGDLDGFQQDELTRTYLLTRWRSLRSHLDAAQFLAEAGVPSKVIGKIWSALGDELEEKITADPWILVRVGGISFKEADEVAARLGVDLASQGRINGAVLTAIQGVATEGHVYATTGQVVGAVNRMIPGPDLPSIAIAEAIKDLRAQGQIEAEQAPDGGWALYEPWSAHMERFCAARLRERGDMGLSEKEEEARLELGKWSQGRKVDLTETQTTAALRSLIEPVSVLTGLPGTGKTTTLQAVVSVLRDLNTPFLLVAPTGIAAKRMTSVTGASAATIHRAFSAKGFALDEERHSSYVGVHGESTKGATATGDTKGEDWGYGPDNPHPAEVLVVDESSMLDLHMLYRLLSGTRETCRLVFVGDPYQLPSVGAGDVLRDLVDCGVFPHTHLSEIFRQEGTSGIVLAAHAVHRGASPDMGGADFMLLPARDESAAAEIIRNISLRLYKKRANFQVLSPRHKGDAGVTALNQILRMAINPPTPGIAERRIGGDVIREDDRIMVIKNDYKKGVYNGDVGKVSRIDSRAKTVEIRVFTPEGSPDQVVSFEFQKGAPPLRLAYAQTIHKSQGQEYDIIIVPVMASFGRQLQRNLLYTAITRAKQRVFIVGESSAVTRAVENNPAGRRNTLLAPRLKAEGGSEVVPSG
jgi:exodeoxyribonuclease V alpha subunit